VGPSLFFGKADQENNMKLSTQPQTPRDLIPNIRKLTAACGSTVNKNDKAIVAIKLCILNGVDTEDHIVHCLMEAGFHNGHAGSILNKNAGASPSRYHWWLDKDERYQLHEE
jgi:hypothetical protein